jgi:hypothetical protein
MKPVMDAAACPEQSRDREGAAIGRPNPAAAFHEYYDDANNQSRGL